MRLVQANRIRLGTLLQGNKLGCAQPGFDIAKSSSAAALITERIAFEKQCLIRILAIVFLVLNYALRVDVLFACSVTIWFRFSVIRWHEQNRNTFRASAAQVNSSLPPMTCASATGTGFFKFELPSSATLPFAASDIAFPFCDMLKPRSLLRSNKCFCHFAD